MRYLDYFKELCSIPHGSGNTAQISEYLVRFARENHFEYHQDKLGNVVIIRPADEQRASEEPYIIQGHMDMVTVKDEGVTLDMKTQGLDLVEEGDFLFARGTSLGADDGIAVAYGLAIMTDPELILPRIELIVTVDEEIGMLGAADINLDMIKGNRMLNIDSEEEGIFLVSCAGGARVDITKPLSTKEISSEEDSQWLRIELKGFVGGHSGTEINKGRMNAIWQMGFILNQLYEEKLIYGIKSIDGGCADNAIPGECITEILCKPQAKERIHEIGQTIQKQYEAVEKTGTIKAEQISDMTSDYATVLDVEGSVARILAQLPNGVVRMSEDIDGLVQTSLNIGIIHVDSRQATISISVRSSEEDEKDELIETICKVANINHADTKTHGNYPGWAYRKNSPLRDAMIQAYESLYNEKPQVMAIHAGLECGVLAEKIKDMDCVSFGPAIYDIHTTKEKLSLSSTERTWQLLKAVLTGRA